MTRITQNDVHNFHVTHVRGQIDAAYPKTVVEAIASAHYRHHQEGTSAQEEAEAINRKFELS